MKEFFVSLLAPGLDGPEVGRQDLGPDQEIHPELPHSRQERLGRELRLVAVPGVDELLEPLL